MSKSKFDLGDSTAEVVRIKKDILYVNSSKAPALEKDIEKQLDVLRSSFLKANELLNRVVSKKAVKGNRLEVYRGWARKAKTQSQAAEKLRNTISDKFTDDLYQYPIKLLDDRIIELEKKMDSIMNQEG